MVIAIDELEGCHEEEGEGEERGSDSRWEQRGSGLWPENKGSRPAASSRASAREEECTGGALTRDDNTADFPLDRWVDGKCFPFNYF
jgi:hypothetical protein